MRTHTIVPVCFLVVTCLLATGAEAVLPYTITDLGTLSGCSHGKEINESGQVVGYSRASNGKLHAFLWQDGAMEDLGTLGGYLSEADGINESGQVVGHADIPSNTRHAFLWEGGTMYDLDPTSARHSWAWAINNSEQIAGTLDLSGTGVTTFLWEDGRACVWEGGAATTLPTLGGDHSAAYDINESGHVAGWAETSTGGHHAVVWDATGVVDLGTLGGVHSWAFAINDIGQAVGWAQMANGENHAFLWQDGAVTWLGLQGMAWDINNHGQVVCSNAASTYLWDDGTLYDLKDLIPADCGWQLMSGGPGRNIPAINDAGQIVGTGINPDGYTRGFLLTPIPEPATFSLMAVGVMALLLLRRRRLS